MKMRCRRLRHSIRQAFRIWSMMSAIETVRAKIVAGDCNRDAARIRAGRQLGKHRRLERAPPAAVNEHGERRLVVVLGGKQIDGLAQRGTVGHCELGIARRRAVGRPLALPAGENLRVFRHAGAVVVFNLVVDGHDKSLTATKMIRLCAGPKQRYLLAMKTGGEQTRILLVCIVRACRSPVKITS